MTPSCSVEVRPRQILVVEATSPFSAAARRAARLCSSDRSMRHPRNLEQLGTPAARSWPSRPIRLCRGLWRAPFGLRPAERIRNCNRRASQPPRLGRGWCIGIARKSAPGSARNIGRCRSGRRGHRAFAPRTGAQMGCRSHHKLSSRVPPSALRGRQSSARRGLIPGRALQHATVTSRSSAGARTPTFAQKGRATTMYVAVALARTRCSASLITHSALSIFRPWWTSVAFAVRGPLFGWRK